MAAFAIAAGTSRDFTEAWLETTGTAELSVASAVSTKNELDIGCADICSPHAGGPITRTDRAAKIATI
jgi:hypothetical protein